MKKIAFFLLVFGIVLLSGCFGEPASQEELEEREYSKVIINETEYNLKTDWCYIDGTVGGKTAYLLKIIFKDETKERTKNEKKRNILIKKVEKVGRFLRKSRFALLAIGTYLLTQKIIFCYIEIYRLNLVNLIFTVFYIKSANKVSRYFYKLNCIC